MHAPIVCLGSCFVDLLARPVSEVPAGQGATLVEEVRITPGAAGATTTALGRLWPEVHVVASIGCDDLGDLLVAQLKRNGVKTEHLSRTDRAQTAATMVPVRPDGSHPSLSVLGALPELRLDDAARALISRCCLLHVNGPELVLDTAREALETARSAGVTTTSDLILPQPSMLGDAIRPLLALVDVLQLNREQALDFFGVSEIEAAAQAALAAGVGAVVITLGAGGCFVAAPEGQERLPAMQANVIDTTGCGDTFSAGLVWGLARGVQLSEAARLGMAAATLNLETLGSGSAVTEADALLAVLDRPTIAEHAA
jgi:sugar/nucleoside kinase (ribokinase family)